jgi:hypothetical protein
MPTVWIHVRAGNGAILAIGQLPKTRRGVRPDGRDVHEHCLESEGVSESDNKATARNTLVVHPEGAPGDVYKELVINTCS